MNKEKKILVLTRKLQKLLRLWRYDSEDLHLFVSFGEFSLFEIIFLFIN